MKENLDKQGVTDWLRYDNLRNTVNYLDEVILELKQRVECQQYLIVVLTGIMVLLFIACFMMFVMFS